MLTGSIKMIEEFSLNKKLSMFCAAFAAGACLLPAAGSAANAQSQRVAIPSYFYPGPTWKQAIDSGKDIGFTIINPASGPGTHIDPLYVSTVKEAQARHVKVLGYVDTAYSKRKPEDVLADVKLFRDWYHVDGIFLDQTSNTLPEVPYYKNLYTQIKAGSPKDIVVLNPGCPTIEEYLGAGDIICTFEQDGATYRDHFVGSAWTAKYPASRFWHIIYKIDNEADMVKVVKLAKQRNAGWVYVTPDTLPNPYDTLPAEGYWRAEIAAAEHK